MKINKYIYKTTKTIDISLQQNYNKNKFHKICLLILLFINTTKIQNEYIYKVKKSLCLLGHSQNWEDMNLQLNSVSGKTMIEVQKISEFKFLIVRIWGVKWIFY